MRTSSAFVEVECPGCLQPYRVSARHARRGVELCRLCRYDPIQADVEPRHLRWWLNHYSDTEIAAMASEMMGMHVAPEIIGANRAVLLASGSLGDDE